MEKRRRKALYYINGDLFDDRNYNYLGTLNLLVNTTNKIKIRSAASTPALPPDTEPLPPQIVTPPPPIARPPTNQPARIFKALKRSPMVLLSMPSSIGAAGSISTRI